MDIITWIMIRSNNKSETKDKKNISDLNKTNTEIIKAKVERENKKKRILLTLMKDDFNLSRVGLL